MPRGDFANDPAFRLGVDALLHRVVDQLDALDTDALDPSLSQGSLTLRFEDGAIFILSPQVPTHELWMSAELRAWHFVCEGGRWIERDSGEPLAQVLGGLTARRLGLPVPLEL